MSRLAAIEAKEREIAEQLPGGFAGVDRVWLRAEAIRQLEALPRCSVCERPLLAEVPDGTGRCLVCVVRNAIRVECGCGFLYEGDEHTCGHESTAPEIA